MCLVEERREMAFVEDVSEGDGAPRDAKVHSSLTEGEVRPGAPGQRNTEGREERRTPWGDNAAFVFIDPEARKVGEEAHVSAGEISATALAARAKSSAKAKERMFGREARETRRGS